jgi:hypothetical protein
MSMSNKRWYATFNGTVFKWQTVGIPYDEGELDREKYQLAFGPFKTKRGSDYVVFLDGHLINGGVQETEAMAKLIGFDPSLVATNKETAPPLYRPLLTPAEPIKLNTEAEIPESEWSSYLDGILHRMMD